MPWICKECGEEVVLSAFFDIKKNGSPESDFYDATYICNNCDVEEDYNGNINGIAEWQEDDNG